MTDRSPPSPAGSDPTPRLWCVVILLAVGLAYINSFPGAFFFDDISTITHNPSLRHARGWWEVLHPPVQAGIGGRPVANLTLAANYAMSGLAPWSYHATNLLLHGLAALVVFGLTRRTLRRDSIAVPFQESSATIAGFVALFWALHPVQTNIVDYASQRTEGLAALLYLLTLYAFVRSLGDANAHPGGATVSTHRSMGWTAVAVGSAALGMAAKETMVTLPAMVWLYDRTFVSGTFRDAARNHGGRLLAITATWAVLFALMASSELGERGIGFGLDVSPATYALTQCRSVLRYLGLTVWPHPLIFDAGPNVYVQSLGVVGWAVLAIAAMLGLTLYALRRAPRTGFGAAWFFLVLAPSSSVVPITQQPYGENRIYLPLAGISVLLVLGLWRAVGRRAVTVLTGAAVGLGAVTMARNPVFQNDGALWQATVAAAPDNPRAHNNLGGVFYQEGQLEAAMACFRTALALWPQYADAHNNLGIALLHAGRFSEAAAAFQRALAERPDDVEAYYNLGETYLQLHDLPHAIAAFEKVVATAPDNARGYNNLGMALLDAGRVADAMAAERRALAMAPDMPEAHYNLGNALARAGLNSDALHEFETALELDPRFAKAANNRGVMLLQLGRTAEAEAALQQALRIDPNYREARANLEAVRARR